MWLAIETSTKQMGVAVVDGERLLSSYELLADYPHAVELPDAVKRVLKAAGITLDQLSGIAVDIGPGSFTGLRIGLAFAKALLYGRKTRLAGVPSMDVLAANLPFHSGLICVLLDARQKNVYGALYRVQGGEAARQGEIYLGPPDEFLARIKEPAVVLGDGAAIYREAVLKRCPAAQFAAPELWLPRAAILARLGQARAAAGQVDDPATLVPLYLYPMDCSVRGPNRPTAILAQPAA